LSFRDEKRGQGRDAETGRSGIGDLLFHGLKSPARAASNFQDAMSARGAKLAAPGADQP